MHKRAMGATCYADPRTTTLYDRRRRKYGHHAGNAVVAFVISG
jgi:hypothetical protein